jgi:hypothetical protein
VAIQIDSSTEGINWAQAKADLAADNFWSLVVGSWLENDANR